LRRGESWREHPQFSLQVVPESDAEFIAACRVAVPELLDEIERLQRELENMDDEMRVQHERDTMED
jgi:hypothetical protein